MKWKKSSLGVVGLIWIVFGTLTVSAQSPYDSVLGATCCISLVILNILLAIAVYVDAERIGMGGVVWGLVVLVLGILGVIIYFMVRTPEESLQEQPTKNIPFDSPSESQVIKEKEIIKEVVKIKCPYCGALVDQGVDRCPNCGAPLR